MTLEKLCSTRTRFLTKLQVRRSHGEILDTLSENDAFSETERAWILEAVRGHRRKCNGMSEVARLFYECDKRSRNCFACPVKEQCNWSEEEKNMEIKI